MNQENFNPQNDPLNQNSGPQFESENQNPGGWRAWITKYGSSVILPIIALLILAGGIYLYSTQKSDQAEVGLNGEEKQLTEQEIMDMLEQESETDNQEQKQEVDQTEQKTDQTIQNISPEITNQGKKIKVKAGTGDGITHLARYALKEYLKDNPQDLTNEHKVYIEDYLKDQIGSRPLEIGEKIDFSEASIQEAINSANQLTENQLQNLEKYSQTIDWE